MPLSLEPPALSASSSPEPAPSMTVRSVVAGFLFAVALCAMNSYLTLSFGVIEEGPTIAALFFFALFFISRMKITTTEMVIVATMGSAGGSFGFISNFFAAKAMTGAPYTIAEMIGFGIVTSGIGLVMVIPLRELLVRREKLPWPGAKATASVIETLVTHGDPRQALYLFATLAVGMFYVVFNNEDGVGWFPAEIAFPASLAAVGGALALTPFALGGAYLMPMRTCVGFLVGAVGLMVLAPITAVPEAPQRFVWPGIGFLTASGLTVIAINWRVMAASIKSLAKLRKPGDVDAEGILSGRAYFALLATVVLGTVGFLNLVIGVPILLVLILIAIGGLLQNLIATRAQAQTAFNPARVMGILLEGVCWMFGGSATAINLTGAGVVAGSGAQAGNLTADMAYGRRFRVPPRWQFLAQIMTIVPCAVAAAFVFQWISQQKDISIESTNLAAPVAKVWATTSLIFDGSAPMPDAAMRWLAIGAIAGVAYTLLEANARLRAWLPCSIGIGLGLILPPAYGIAFFVGGFVLWIVLGRWLRWRDVTLTSIAVGSVVAEGLGGVTKALLATFGVLGN